MKITKRRVISVLLIAATIFSVAVFASSCGDQSEKEVDMIVHVKITGSSENHCDNDLKMTGLPSELTILAATRRMCVEVLEIDFVYDEGYKAVKQIGTNISELLEPKRDEEEPAEGEEPADGEEDEEETTEAAVDDFYYDWVFTLNGVSKIGDTEIKLNDLIKAGDVIVWEWKQVKKEFEDKNRNPE